jgi:hypothetical protein
MTEHPYLADLTITRSQRHGDRTQTGGEVPPRIDDYFSIKLLLTVLRLLFNTLNRGNVSLRRQMA